MPDDWDEEGKGDSKEDSDDEEDKEEKEEKDTPLDWTVELLDSRGNRASLPLSHDSGLYPLINAIPRRARFLDSTDPTEVLFRRFELPVADFVAVGAAPDPGSLVQVSFIFDRSKKGAIILDDLSISTHR